VGQYDNYICTTLQKRDMLPGPNPAEVDKLHAAGKRIAMEHTLWLDSDVIPGAYYAIHLSRHNIPRGTDEVTH
jgi:hypothetical protein